MKTWTEEQLIACGYDIKNAKITSADLSMRDHGVLTLDLGLEGYGWGCIFGGRVLGHGYIGADAFDGTPNGIEYIERIMDVVGAERFKDMENCYVRVATRGVGSSVDIIGDIIKDKWFDTKSFFESGD